MCDPSAKVVGFLSPPSLSHTQDTTNKLDQTDSRRVVRVVWIRALLRTDSNLRSWVDFSLGHRQIYLAAAVVARFASLSSFSSKPQQRSLLIDTLKMEEKFLRITVYLTDWLYSFVIHQFGITLTLRKNLFYLFSLKSNSVFKRYVRHVCAKCAENYITGSRGDIQGGPSEVIQSNISKISRDREKCFVWKV